MTTLDITRSSPTAIDLSRAGSVLREVIAAQRAFGVSAVQQLARASPTHRVAAIMILLMTGIALAIVTTPDPLWWQLHFSELGTFDAFSSVVFNGTLLTAGLAIVAFSRYFHRELTKHAARSGSRRFAPRLLSVLYGSLGIHLGLVGGIPVNTWTFMHDRGAQGMVLSFLGILIATPVLLRGLGRALAAITLPAAGLLIGGAAAMITGIINLAAYELVGFAVMFTWVLLFVACLGKYASVNAVVESEAEPVPVCLSKDAPHRIRRVRLRTPVSASTISAVDFDRPALSAPIRPSTDSFRAMTRRRGASLHDVPTRRFSASAETRVIDVRAGSAGTRRIVRRPRAACPRPVRLRAAL